MKNSRREFLKIGGVAAGFAALGAPKLDAAAEPVLGLIFPPLNYPIPEDARLLYPVGVKFISNGVGLPGGMAIESYDEAIPRVLPRAADLAKEGANVISVFGSSLTFYKGRKFHDDLIRQVTKLTGLPATTQSNGLIQGLRAANAKRVAVATAYSDIVTERLRIFLEEHDFQVTTAKGLGFVGGTTGGGTTGSVTQEGLYKFSADVYATSNKADALIISCGGLKTLHLIVPLETEIKVPVVSSTPHGLWQGVQMLGLSGKSKGYGMVIEKG
jgi:arylmalonate decarboxylase